MVPLLEDKMTERSFIWLTLIISSWTFASNIMGLVIFIALMEMESLPDTGSV
jgi:hypothetical protein